MDEKDKQLITDYLDGLLNEAEASIFAERLDKDPELAKEFRVQKDMHQFLQKRAKKKTLENQLSSIGKDFFLDEEQPAQNKTIPIHRRRWLIAASAAVIALLLYFTFFRPVPIDQQFAQHEPLSLVTKSSNNSDLASKAEIAFNNKNYQAAIQYLTKYIDENPADNMASLYKGICWMETGNFIGASNIFRALSESRSVFKNEAIWYLAAVNYRKGEVDKVRTLLEKIPQESSRYKDAHTILKRIK